MSRSWIWLLALVLGCGGASEAIDGGSCPGPPSTCPSSVPRYIGQVASIVSTHCQGCHEPGAVSANWPLTTYDQIYSMRFEVQSMVGACLMPEQDAGQLTESERSALLGWLVCGAPNN